MNGGFVLFCALKAVKGLYINMKKLLSLFLVLTIVMGVINLAAPPVLAAPFDDTVYCTTGNQRADVVGIAATQEYYCEGNDLSQLDGTVQGHGNYTKYARDMGYENGKDWCATFVSWCAKKAGAKGVYLTAGAGYFCSQTRPYKKNGIGVYHATKQYTYGNPKNAKTAWPGTYTPPVENYIPQIGDFVLYKGDEQGSVSHVAIVASKYNNGNFTIIEGNAGRNKNGVWNTIVQKKPEKMSNEKVIGFYSPDYDENGSHVHNYGVYTETGHPHQRYNQCACGRKYYLTGNYASVSSCTNCYPLGNANLTRSFSKTGKTATFYRNNVANATGYGLQLYKNGNTYNSYDMTSTSYTVSGLPSGDYTAQLTVSNLNTGERKTVKCEPFTIVNSYRVKFDANGGTNAPGEQEKIHDVDLTLTTSKPTKVHYIFKGWATAKNATEVVYESGSTYDKNAAITLYAVWEPETYTVSFDANGGMGEISPISITYGDTMRMPNTVFSQEAYLRGWGISASTSTVSYRLGMDYKIDKNLDLFAVWAASTWANEVADSFAGGSGMKDDPYQISNASELAYLAHTVNSQTSAPEYKYYKLTDNIDFNFAEWLPIGVGELENQYFHGSFDGDGYTISNMVISEATSPYVGLFGYAKESNIKNLNVISDIYGISSSEQTHIGGLVGYAKDSTINNCHAIYGNVSGLANTSTPVNISNFSNAGALVGTQNGGEIKDCSATDCYMAANSGSFNMGIIAGMSDGTLSGNNVISSENLFGQGSSIDSICIGSIVGTSSGTIEKCSVKAGHMTSNLKIKGGAAVGGIVGNLEGEISLCSVQFTNENKEISANVESTTSQSSTELKGANIGGVVGHMGIEAKLSDCKYDGLGLNAVGTTGDVAVGGLAGVVETSSDSFTIKGGRFIDITTLPTRNGYKAKWYKDSEFTELFNFGTMIDSDVTLYAKWEKEEQLPVWNGTSKEPAYNASTKTYTITTGEELAWVADVTKGIITTGSNFPADKSFSGYTVALGNDIALNDTTSWQLHTDPGADKNRNWKIIGNEANPFSGTFDGQGNTIYGLYFADEQDEGYIGLFGYVVGTIKNTCFSNVYISTGSNCSGAVVTGYLNGTLTNCHNIYNVMITHTGRADYLGGIVAETENSEISCCSNSKNVKIYNIDRIRPSIGGIVAVRYHANVSRCYNAATIYSEAGPVGGISGSGYGLTQYCYNSGDISVTSSGTVGGICGNLGGSSNSGILYCGNEGNVIGSGDSVGGIVGSFGNNSTTQNKGIEYCYNKGDVTLSSHDGYGYEGVGGIAGDISGLGYNEGIAPIKINGCYNSGNILLKNTSTGRGAGGIIGTTDGVFYDYLNATIYGCYNTGSVNAPSGAGGILGQQTSDHSSLSVVGCYNLGNISVSENYGGIVGEMYGTQILTCTTSTNSLYGNITNTTVKKSYTNTTNAATILSRMESGTAYTLNLNICSSPYITKLANTYLTHTIKTVTGIEERTPLNRSFANIKGDISSTSSKNASSGGIIGSSSGNGAQGDTDITNLLSIADGIYSTSNGSSSFANSGLIIGNNINSSVSASNTYAYSDTLVDATNTVNSSNISEDTTCTETKPINQITRVSFLTTLFGPAAYKSLNYLDTDETAVWVIKVGQLPELYYNCLRDIIVSDEIEHGTITLDTYQAIDGEIINITAAPDEGYELNKFYVNGEEGTGTTFEVSGNSEVYAVFTPIKEKYDVTLAQTGNASVSLANADTAVTLSLAGTSDSDALTAEDGQEIVVSADADELYTIDSVLVNGDEIAGNSFILTEDTVVDLNVTSIDTAVKAVTNDVTISTAYYAYLSGSVNGADENTSSYIRYWKTDEPDVVLITEVKTGSAEYEALVMDLMPNTQYSYQMLDCGEIKTFTTPGEEIPEAPISDDDYFTKTTFVSDENKFTFTVNNIKSLTTENIYVAAYTSQNKLVAIECVNLNGKTSETVHFSTEYDIGYVKVYAWDENLEPIGETEYIFVW